ncbi:MAG: segregation/condensation protein A [Desulfuromonadales bacterium]
MNYDIRLDKFEGPLDLLLHLIRKNEMDIYDIQIAEITAQYLTILDEMKGFNLDVAGEFLLMAATLLHIKSRLLLPAVEDETGNEEEEEDPRAELVRRLLEYQKYSEAAVALDAFPLLERDIFARRFPAPDLTDTPAEEPMEAVGLYELMEAFRALLRENPQAAVHEVTAERLSVTDRINRILFLLSGRESLSFPDLFSARPDRQEIVVTFLAMLELVKLRLLRLMQNGRHGAIWVFPAVSEEDAGAVQLTEDAFGYG